MAYQIVKGWPSESAIDEVITLATVGTVLPGFGGVINSDGEGVVGSYPTTAGTTTLNLPFFCIDVDSITQKVTGLMHKCVIEMDAEHYAAGTYLPGAKLTLDAGKFDIIALTADERTAVARVISYNATTAKLRVLWL